MKTINYFKRKNVLIYAIVLIAYNSIAQNLVPNPSFETYNNCPTNVSQITEANSWYPPTSGTADYYNVCANSIGSDAGVPLNFSGNEAAHTGDGYGGIITYYQPLPTACEYIQVQLSSPLVAGENYSISFWASCAESNFAWATLDYNGLSTKLSAYLSTTGNYYANWNTYPGSPQITSLGTVDQSDGWTQISGVYTATGGEQFLTIGNWDLSTVGTGTTTYAFSNIAYYYVDDVSVQWTDCPNIISYSSPNYCTNSTNENVLLVGNSGGVFSSTSGLSIDGSTGSINPSLSTPGTYTISYTENGCVATTFVNIVSAGSATITYNSPFCSDVTSGLVTMNGATNGIYTSTNGLTIDSATGEINPSTSTPGSYTVSYTIAASGGCPAYSVTTQVVINTPITAIISYSSPICANAENQQVLLIGAAGGSFSASPTGLQLNGINGEITPTGSNIGNYTVSYLLPATGGCPASITTVAVEILPLPTISTNSNVTLELGSTVLLTASGGGTYSWSPNNSLSCSDCSNPQASPLETTIYCVTVTNNGCSATKCVNVTVIPRCDELFIPNVFSPNGNALDDEFCLYNTACLLNLNFRIYNEWGEIIYEYSEGIDCWDGVYKGQMVSTGVYAYTLSATNSLGEEIKKEGTIQLLK